MGWEPRLNKKEKKIEVESLKINNIPVSVPSDD